MQGEHCYVLTSLLIVYAGQHAAFKDEIGPSRARLDGESRFAQRSYKLAKASQEPVRDPSSPRWRFGGLLAKIAKTGSAVSNGRAHAVSTRDAPALYHRIVGKPVDVRELSYTIMIDAPWPSFSLVQLRDVCRIRS